MPSETFIRLPDSKRQRIVDAIKREVERSSYENFSVGSIIHECEISRGSFYQYFPNKEDIYLYLLSCYQKQILEHAIETLRRNGGDFFDTFEEVYRFAVRMLCHRDSKAFRHNLFCNFRLYELMWQKNSAIEKRFVQEFRSGVNTDLLRLNSPEEFTNLFEICLFSCFRDVIGIFMADYSEQTVLEHFKCRVRLLRRAYQK